MKYLGLVLFTPEMTALGAAQAKGVVFTSF